jgi:ADP-heptose:LPS heptosyltransferase
MIIKKSLRLFRDVFFFVADWFIVKSIIIKGVSSGLLVVRMDAIGDFVIWLDSAKELRRCFPDMKITLLANASWAELAKHFDYWDEVIPASLIGFVKNPLYRWSMLRRIRKLACTVAIQPQYTRVSLVSDSIIRASLAKVRIASVGDKSYKDSYQQRCSDGWYTRLLAAQQSQMMELERNAEFLAELSGFSYTAKVPYIPVLLDLSSNLRPQKRYFIVFPGASAQYRQWPIEKFAYVIDHISRVWGLHPVLCGSGGEKDLCAELSSLCSFPCLDYSGRTSLPEFVEVIRGSLLLIGNETSAVHIATAVQVPAICILGGGHYERFMPYPEFLDGVKPYAAVSMMECFGCNWQCTQEYDKSGPVPCISRISVEQVLHLVDQSISCFDMDYGT